MTSSSVPTLPRDERLAGRTAIVTGSSSGIGEAIAHVLAASGAHVVVHGRSTARTEAVAAAIGARGGRASVVIADLAESPTAARDFAARAVDALGGRADILVNNAGIFPVGPTADLSDEDVAALLATNIRVPHDLVGALAPAMAERGEGVVVNITSWMANVGTPAVGLYPATKAALDHLTKAWAAEYGPQGVRVNSVAPGATLTPGNADAAAILEAMTAGSPAGTPGRPVDIAFAVRYLASDEAAYVHGATIDVDGGIVSARV
ncbi:NAD(P)-dependent dehydrogenase (short-subunit alcohol dehydrogenase family) [Microbacterium sp. AK009]|uniref:SDR family NAD(P)-dependent oxidoreductase n=1 Tax=Microbacterium sp. AK009 TaxID=2723068 RepID=UPI0015CA480C|nr:SDR family oxidoreductase [Microbacterium sp. AK009]NYF15618.1 NAD(P)-dependent dehydrogenase (short-subunit alcohol dehydrogenase family) [Microbacterium sp. AK009]